MDAILQNRLEQGNVDEAHAAEQKSTIGGRAVDSARSAVRRLLSGMRMSDLKVAAL